MRDRQTLVAYDEPSLLTQLLLAFVDGHTGLLYSLGMHECFAHLRLTDITAVGDSRSSCGPHLNG